LGSRQLPATAPRKPSPGVSGLGARLGAELRHERYPAYKATREKLTDELQSDFDTGMERICQLLDAYRIPILSLRGYEPTT
jgi:5'-3' exonuclease